MYDSDSNMVVDYGAQFPSCVETESTAFYTCQIAGNTTCTVPLEGNIRSIRMHLRQHGYRQKECSAIICPWQGCKEVVQYRNLPRHVRSIHLGVKLRCAQCGKGFTRADGMAKHLSLHMQTTP